MLRASCCISKVVDGIKLKVKECTASLQPCSNCSVACQEQEEDRPKHTPACTKRADRLRDEVLFKQPESTHLGDCPICLLPLSLDLKKSRMQACAAVKWSHGCNHANKMCELEASLPHKCPFCRCLVPETDEQANMNAQ